MAAGRVWDADNGVWLRIGGPPNVVDPTEPASPLDGLIWTNPTDGVSKIWDADGDEWIIVGTGAGGGGGAGHVVDPVEPVTPEDGLIWVNPDEEMESVAWSVPTFVTTLPASPVDGQEVYYAADAVNSIIWHLRYRASLVSSYKWEFLGGNPLHHSLDASTGAITSGVFVDLSGGATLTPPLAGDYLLSFGANAQGSVATAQIFLAMKVGAAAAAYQMILQPPGANYHASGQPMRTVAINIPTAALVCKMQAWVNSGTMTFVQRWMTLTPMRVI
jgi:hypothetical protein